jgi:HK97 family phage major capsid protein
MADEKVLDEIKEIGAAAQKGIKLAEERLSKSIEEKTGAIKADAVKEAQSIIDGVKTEFEKEYGQQIETLKGDLKKTADDFVKYKAEMGTQFEEMSPAATIADAIIKELKKPQSKERLKSLKDNSSAKASFSIQLPNAEVKSPDVMSRANVTGGTALLSGYETGTVRIVRRRPFLRSVLAVGPAKSKFVVYFELTNPDGGAGMTAEGNSKSQADFEWVERTVEVKKVTAFIKVTTEALEDIEEAEADIRQELIELIELKLDEQLLSGDGNTNNIKGLSNWATAFTTGGIVIASPNQSDAIRTAVAVMVNNNFQPSHVLISPLDAGEIDMEKGGDGHYVLPPFNTRDGMRLSGVQVVENPGVAQGTAYLIDASKVKVRIRKDLTLSVGYDQDDFTKNRVTFLAELRACEFVANNHANAVVKIDFATAIEALTNGASS